LQTWRTLRYAAVMGDVSQDLIERAKQGDPQAIDTLLARHLPGLREFVANRVGQLVDAKESASDLVQSACREVLQHMDRLQYDGEDGFRQWLYTTALRKIKDRHRYYLAEKRDARREVPIAPQTSSDASRFLELYQSFGWPSQEAVLREELERLQRVFEELPDNYRQVITLAYIERLPHAEISQRLGITEPHARVLLSRALARLAGLLRKSEGGPPRSEA
jgi:RNA polymerase sigma-70 factor (ECF subfamily)